MSSLWLNLIWILLFSLLNESLSTKPNILLILVDDLGWNDVGFHGLPTPETTAIDDLAQKGLILNNYYTQSLCTPSRAALLTGIYPFKLGMQHSVLSPNSRYGLPLEYTLLSQDLQNYGYNTSIFGKWHIGYFNEKYTPNQRGFDNFYGYYNGMQSFYTHIMNFTFKSTRYERKDLFDNGNPVDDNNQYSTDIYKKKTIDTINDYILNPSNPFFIYLAFQEVHEPLEQPPNITISCDECTINRRKKLAKIQMLDNAIGEIVTALNAPHDNLPLGASVWDNTLLIFSSDNGAPYGDGGSNFPLRGSKSTLWEGGIRGTAFISGGYLNDSRRNTSTNEPMHITDIYPTIMDILSLTASNESIMDGTSFLNVIQHPHAKSLRDHTILNIDPVGCNNSRRICGGIRNGDLKLVIGNQVAKLSTPEPPINNDLGISGWVSPNNIPYSGILVSHIPACDVTQVPSDWNATNVKDKCPFNGEPCLFNITEDPCEFNNLADQDQYKSMVEMMISNLTSYNQTQQLPLNTLNDPIDLDKLPSTEFWAPWSNTSDIRMSKDGNTSTLSISSPSSDPTLEPTFVPTGQPTVNPTTPNPTLTPTIPTFNPTSEPSLPPTFSPTHSPLHSKPPTNSPTLSPTTAPSQPSIPPSNAPSFAPTDDTESPTHSPLHSDGPTNSPSSSPTLSPTIPPTIAPTNIPTTAEPSKIPTLSPSKTPTSQRHIVTAVPKKQTSYMTTFYVATILSIIGCCCLFACIFYYKKCKEKSQSRHRRLEDTLRGIELRGVGNRRRGGGEYANLM